MGGTKVVLALMAAAALVLQSGAAMAVMASVVPPIAALDNLGGMRGEVVAVNPNADTVIVKADNGKKVALNVTNSTIIRQGIEHEKLANLKDGEAVRVMYQGKRHDWTADRIRVLNPLVPVMGTQGPDIR
jgi:hypothetical protein